MIDLVGNIRVGDADARSRDVLGRVYEYYFLSQFASQLFYSTQIPACLWFLARRRPRRSEVLFIDAHRLGRMVGRTHRELTDEEIARIAGAYHAWRDGADAYEDLPGYCKSASREELAA